MRNQLSKEAGEAKLLKRYHRLYTPIVELIQTLEDIIPPGAVLGDKIELSQVDGYVEVATTLKPRILILNDGKRRFRLVIEEIKK
jgi:hypothetical protein